MLVALVLSCLVYLAFMVTKAVLAFAYAVNEETADGPLADGSIAVLQAILSGDPRLAEMLESNLFSLPGQHFVWLCDESDEEGIRVTDDLMKENPLARITRLLCPPCPDEVNPKVFKLMLAEPLVV
jgi:ceramide glucosyltransferase